jgi:orotate phosphoribosyltransferase
MARGCATEAARVCYEAALKADAPEFCVQMAKGLSREGTQALMGHRGMALILATGGSTITAIERVREAGLMIDRVIALIDREEGGRENILAHVDRVDAVLTRTEIMSLYNKGMISQAK